MEEPNGETWPEGLEPVAYLEQLEYGISLWDMVQANGEQEVAVLAHETTDDVLGLPEDTITEWRAGSFRQALPGEVRVVPVVLMAYFYPLKTYYAPWLNFYGNHYWPEKKAFETLAKQKYLPLIFYDSGPLPVREFFYPNNLRGFFSSQSQLLKFLPEWTVSDFNQAKEQIEDQYSPYRMWHVLGKQT